MWSFISLRHYWLSFLQFVLWEVFFVTRCSVERNLSFLVSWLLDGLRFDFRGWNVLCFIRSNSLELYIWFLYIGINRATHFLRILRSFYLIWLKLILIWGLTNERSIINNFTLNISNIYTEILKFWRWIHYRLRHICLLIICT